MTLLCGNSILDEASCGRFAVWGTLIKYFIYIEFWTDDGFGDRFRIRMLAQHLPAPARLLREGHAGAGVAEDIGQIDARLGTAAGEQEKDERKDPHPPSLGGRL